MVMMSNVDAALNPMVRKPHNASGQVPIGMQLQKTPTRLMGINAVLNRLELQKR